MYRISQRGQRGLRSEQYLNSDLNFGASNSGRGICSALFQVYSGESLSKIPLLLVLLCIYKACVIKKKATWTVTELSNNIRLKIKLCKI
jgi:hypothetical protein